MGMHVYLPCSFLGNTYTTTKLNEKKLSVAILLILTNTGFRLKPVLWIGLVVTVVYICVVISCFFMVFMLILAISHWEFWIWDVQPLNWNKQANYILFEQNLWGKRPIQQYELLMAVYLTKARLVMPL